jgi:hypothetical protein
MKQHQVETAPRDLGELFKTGRSGSANRRQYPASCGQYVKVLGTCQPHGVFAVTGAGIHKVGVGVHKTGHHYAAVSVNHSRVPFQRRIVAHHLVGGAHGKYQAVRHGYGRALNHTSISLRFACQRTVQVTWRSAGYDLLSA